MPTSSRLLTLLSLLQARRDWPGAELADRLEVSGRTVRRDVERLRELGYPVESLTGPAGGYTLRAGSAMPPLLLDDDEAIAIAVGLRTAARASVTGIEEAAVRALVKLEQVLPSRLRRRVTALGAATEIVAVGGPTVDPEQLTVLAAACRDSERLRLPTPTAAARRPAARSSPSPWSTPGGAGTSSAGTVRERAGAPSASTAWRAPHPPGSASRPASFRRPTLRPS